MTAVSMRRLAVIAAVLGVAMIAVLIPFGLLGVALFGCVGIGLGLLNTALIRRTAERYAASDDPHKKRRSAGNVLGRLAIITLLALGFAMLLRPDGLGVFLGLAVFQFVMIFVVTVPLIKELRRSGAQT
ncbi:MAG TPA: ATP synthase subunit I [Pseudonocardiaceae bacterium]|jgi:ATP synthase I chain|nr:ATP synthase subunit I [Pseudonocardiaceae bacterium]